MKFLRTDRQRGVTLVELLVAVVIGLVVVLAATNVLLIGETHKRTTNSNNDMSQSGAFAAYSLDRAVRSAGSGYALAWDQGVFGCRLNATRTVVGTVLPRDTAFPVPFQNVLGGAGPSAAGNLRLAPVLIGKDQSSGGSDVIIVMSGNASAGDSARQIRSGVAGTDNLRLDNTIGLSHGDIGLVTLPGGMDCLIEQVDVMDPTSFTAAGNEILPLGGAYLNGGATLSSQITAGNAFFSALGNIGANNVQFQMFGVDTNRTLVAYDILRNGAIATDTDPILPLADGVVEMRALYGIDTSSPRDNIVDSWVAPTGAWAIENVMIDPVKLRQILAVRIALVIRSSNYEKSSSDAQDVTPARPALFSDTSAAIAAAPYPAGTDLRHFRIRVIDTTIPLRNTLLLPAP